MTVQRRRNAMVCRQWLGATVVVVAMAGCTMFTDPDEFAQSTSSSAHDTYSGTDTQTSEDTHTAFDGVVGSGSCTNAEDMAIFNDRGQMGIESHTFACSMECGLGVDTAPCLNDCIASLGLTEPCSSCFVQAALCVGMVCVGECSGGPHTADCQSCQVRMGCRDNLLLCTGVEPN